LSAKITCGLLRSPSIFSPCWKSAGAGSAAVLIAQFFKVILERVAYEKGDLKYRNDDGDRAKGENRLARLIDDERQPRGKNRPRSPFCSFSVLNGK
jgi:hypothetical protein